MINLKRIFENIYFSICSLFYKRDERIVLFGAWFGNSYSDNSRFLYEYLSNNKEKFGLKKVVWVTYKENICEKIRHNGYECYLMDSKESVFYHKKAKYHIICNSAYDSNDAKADIITKYSYGAIKINLWHGVGAIKRVGFNRENTATNLLLKLKKIDFIRFLYSTGGWDRCFYLVTSAIVKRQMMEITQLPSKYYFNGIYPRLCGGVKLFDEEQSVIDLLDKYDGVILYAPTFRPKNINVDLNICTREFKEFLIEKNYVLVTKAHGFCDNLNIEKSRNVLYLESQFDINIIMNKIDILITDYSSIALDAYYYGSKVLFYLPDYWQYKKYVGITDDAREIFNGNECFSMDELLVRLNKNDVNDGSKVKLKYWGNNLTDLEALSRKILALKN